MGVGRYFGRRGSLPDFLACSRSPIVTMLAVGVGHDEDPAPEVWGPKLCSRKHCPFRIVPEAGKVREHFLSSLKKEPWDILKEDVRGS